MSDSLARPPSPEENSAKSPRRRRRRRSPKRPAGEQTAGPADGQSRSRPDRPAPAPFNPRPLPTLDFPAELPVSAIRDEIAEAIAGHPVVVICGETGSGKTTQIPKICAQVGQGVAGRIGHTQPRRIAATAVARRLAEEIGTPLGEHVGFKVRFSEQLDPGTTFKVMTDGILLAEIQSDPNLRQYDTLIIDEAHERSLNIDFLLGYLKTLLTSTRRDDLKVIITSATIDADRFAAHFGSATKPAPVIQVSGRLFPVEVLYQDDLPAGSGAEDEDDETELPALIERSVEMLWRSRTGDILVFLPGEREIREATEHLRRVHEKALAARAGVLGKGAMEIVPLFARLSVADQQRVFSPSSGRRVVLATNVAETSLTVPGIRFVIDSGLARVKRYRLRGKVEQLQIEAVSQAAANQRAGRCGRVADGICVRLYTADDYEQRPRFTDPEVLRSSLAGVILRMKSLRLGAVEEYPFIDAPNSRAVTDGYALLLELGAVDDQRRLTATGRQLSRIPLDPRMARMLLSAHENACLNELLTIAAFLSIQDPRDRPPDRQQAADQAQKEFRDPSSDFLGILRLWRFSLQADAERRESGQSRRSLARLFEKHFLSVRRMREWADVRSQLAQSVRELKWAVNTDPAKPEHVHQTLLTGLLGNLGFMAPDKKQYQGTHQTVFSIHPASVLTRKPPRWVMCAEMVDTARLFGRNVAAVQPEWIEKQAGHLLTRSSSEPLWSRKSGQAIVYERASLYGLQIYAQRSVPLDRTDPAKARELFIRHALVQDDWLEASRSRHLGFFQHNRALVASIRKLEDRIRRPDLLVDEDFIQQWFEARLPADITSGRRLDAWYRKAVGATPDLLRLRREELMRKDAAGVASEEFPRSVLMHGTEFELRYRFDPGSQDDGVTMQIPLPLLNQVDADRCEWLVPGLLRQKVAGLAKSLPQRSRRHLVPLPAYAQDFALRWADRVNECSIVDALRADIAAQFRVQLAASDFRPDTLAPHLFMRFQVLDPAGHALGSSRHLAQLQSAHGGQARGAFRDAFAAAAKEIRQVRKTPDPADETAKDSPVQPSASAPEAAGSDRDTELERLIGERHTRWPVEGLPGIVEVKQPGSGVSIVGYPAFVDHGDAVMLEVLDDEREARHRHRLGIMRLLTIACRSALKSLQKGGPDQQKRIMVYARIGDDEALRSSIDAAVIDRACAGQEMPVDRKSYVALSAHVSGRVGLVGVEVLRRLDDTLVEYNVTMRKRNSVKAAPGEDYVRAVLADVDRQLGRLITPRFIAETPAAQFGHLPRYLKAITMRLTHMRADPDRERRHMAALQNLTQRYERARDNRLDIADPELDQFRWLLEELRVSLFAQSLRTPMPVSIKRLTRILERAGA